MHSPLFTAQKMKFFIKEMLNGKLHFLCCVFNHIVGKADQDQEEKHCIMLNLKMSMSYVQADFQASACS